MAVSLLGLGLVDLFFLGSEFEPNANERRNEGPGRVLGFGAREL